MKKNNLLYFIMAGMILFIIAGSGLPGCGKSTDIPEGMVAQVNDQYLVKDQVNYKVPDGLSEEMQLALQKKIISSWVDREALYQSALREGFELSEKEMFLIEDFKKSLIVQRYLSQIVDRNFNITQKRIEEYYSEHRDQFIRSEDEIHIIHLLIEQRDQAIFSEIARADDLMQIIGKYYFDERSSRERPNGDLGYVAISQIPDEFVRVLRRMRNGAISSPIRTDQGYHFLQLLDLQKAGSTRELTLVKDEIILRLQKERRQDELDRLMRDLKDKFQIQTYLSKLQE